VNLTEPADRVHVHTVNIGANNGTPGGPQTFTLTMERGRWLGVEIVVPPGHGGQTGIALMQSGAQMLPYDDGDYFVADDDVLSFALDGLGESGLWAALVYNLDDFAHAFYLRFAAAHLDLDAAGALPATVRF
jgi:hypothetical protein